VNLYSGFNVVVAEVGLIQCAAHILMTQALRSITPLTCTAFDPCACGPLFLNGWLGFYGTFNTVQVKWRL